MMAHILTTIVMAESVIIPVIPRGVWAEQPLMQHCVPHSIEKVSVHHSATSTRNIKDDPLIARGIPLPIMIQQVICSSC